MNPVRHLLTVDLEEYFHAVALRGAAPRRTWNALPPRAAQSTDEILEMLARADARATFFVLGRVAAGDPGLVRRIADAGHEIASHGWDHDPVTWMWPKQFRADAQRSRATLEDTVGVEVAGYRAPCCSIVRGFEWAFDVLIEEGYRYDSSVFPGRTGHPGRLPAPWYTVERSGGTLMEVPLTSARIGPWSLPVGGAFFRLLPYPAGTLGLRQAQAAGHPAMFYLHPWEIDPGQPRLPVGLATQARHYTGLRCVRERLDRLLQEFSFTSIRDALETSRPGAPAPLQEAFA